MNYPIQEKITARIFELANQTVTDLHNPSDIPLVELRKILQLDPTIHASASLICLRGSLIVGKFSHSNKRFTDEINEMFDNIQGSFTRILQQIFTAIFLGFHTSEIVIKLKKGKHTLDELIPLKSDRVIFRGRNGNIDEIKYLEKDCTKYIPAYKSLIVSYGVDDKISPYGQSRLRSVYPLYKIKTSLLADMALAAKISSTGILWGSTNSQEHIITDANNNPLLNPDGTQVKKSSAEYLLKQLLSLENNSVIVTDKDTTLTRLPSDGSQFGFINAIKFIDENIKATLWLPSYAFSTENIPSGVTATLVLKQMSLLDNLISGVVVQIQDQLIEKVVKPIIFANYGYQTDWGKFHYEPETDMMQDIQLATQISSMVSMGLIPQTDLAAINKIRKLLTLDPVDKLPEPPAEQQPQDPMSSYP